MSFALFNIVVIGVVYWECPIKKNPMKSSMESDNCYIRHHGTVEAGNLAPTPENLLRPSKTTALYLQPYYLSRNWV